MGASVPTVSSAKRRKLEVDGSADETRYTKATPAVNAADPIALSSLRVKIMRRIHEPGLQLSPEDACDQA